jgi:hypothetical protein
MTSNNRQINPGFFQFQLEVAQVFIFALEGAVETDHLFRGVLADELFERFVECRKEEQQFTFLDQIHILFPDPGRFDLRRERQTRFQ